MGWDIDRFPEGEVNLELICCICTCILEDPVESPCRHVFCSQCIKTWLSNQKSCPHCRAPVHKKDLQSVVPLLKNIISKQRIFCDNKGRGCPECIPLESLSSHLAGCMFTLISCSNDGCNVKIMRKDHKSHSDNCSKQTVMCEQGCDMFLTLGERNQHNCTQALRQHFQEVSNEMLTRISKLEELVNILITSKNDSHQRSSRTNTVPLHDITYNCAPYTIPSPRSYNAAPPPYTVSDPPTEINNTINLTAYTSNDFSDDVESVDSDHVVNDNVPIRSTRQRSVSPLEREMSPVYDHLNRTVQFGNLRSRRDDRHREVHRECRRSRSPHFNRSRQGDTTFTRSNVTLRPDRESHNERQHNYDNNHRSYENNERASRRSDTNQQEEPLVLRIGVSSQTVSDSSTSSSSSSSETDTD